MVLAHGLLGFAELRVAGGWLPAVHYWRGITNALTANGVEVIITAVPPVCVPRENTQPPFAFTPIP